MHIKKYMAAVMVLLIALTLFVPGNADAAGAGIHGWIPGDGHSHTSYSDGKNTSNEMFDAARAAGLNYLIIADHHNSKAYPELSSYSSNAMLSTIWGQEYSKSDEGHATIMSLTPLRNYKPNYGDNNSVMMSMKDMINEVHANGALVFAAHPMDTGNPPTNESGVPMRVTGWRDYAWDGLEVWNGYYGGRHTSTVEAFKVWDEMNVNGRRMLGVAQSDAHDASWFGKTCYSRVYVNALTASDIFNAYKKGNVYGTNGPTLDFTVNGQMMGSDVAVSPTDNDAAWEGEWNYKELVEKAVSGTSVDVHMAGQYSGGLKRAILIKNGTGGPERIEIPLNGVTSFSRDITVEVSDGDFLRMELEGADGDTLTAYSHNTTGFAFSNPVFIKEESLGAAILLEKITEAQGVLTANEAYAYTKQTLDNINGAIDYAKTTHTAMGAADSKARPGSDRINLAYNMLVRAINDFGAFAKVPKTPGLQTAGGGIYLVKSDGFLTTGLTDYQDAKYYFSEYSGLAQLNWQQSGDKWYYFTPTGDIASKGKAATGFLTVGTRRFYLAPFPDCTMATGIQTIDNVRYSFSSGGSMQTGWVASGDTWYYFDPTTGAGQAGWFTSANQRYYLDPLTGLAAVGKADIEGKTYFFNKNAQLVENGSVTVGDKTYYLVDGAVQKGWFLQNNYWYYADEETGSLRKGWFTDGQDRFGNDIRYYLDPVSGAMRTGWLQDNGWYYLQGSGSMARGFIRINGKWNEFNANSGKWVREYANGSGWQNFAKGWAFKTGSGWAYGWKFIENQWYYFDSQGYMQTGWRKVGSTWYYFRSGGDMAIGWLNLGKWYYLSQSGAMRTGWYQEGDVWYYLRHGSGDMATGWVETPKGTWYYLKSTGVMAASEQLNIGGTVYTFNADGKWIP